MFIVLELVALKTVCIWGIGLVAHEIMEKWAMDIKK